MQLARFRSLYFAYFASTGLLMTYGPWHFAAVGLDPSVIGSVFAARTALSLLTQPLYGRLDDRLGRPVALLRAVLAAAFVASFVLPFSVGLRSVAAGVLLVALFESAFVPVADSLVLRTVGTARYGGVRLWGSLGYGVVVALVGWLALDQVPGTVGKWALFGCVGLTGLAMAVAWTLREPASAGGTGAEVPGSRHLPAPTEPRVLPPIPWSTPLVLLLASGACHWVAITAFNIFFSLRVAEAGHDARVVGAGVLVAIVAEATAFAGAGWLFRQRDPAWWLAPAFAVGAVRWWVTATTDSGWALVATQSLHALGFGVWFAASLGVLRRLGPLERASSMQALFSAVVLSGGGIVGGVLMGRVAHAASYREVFLTAAAVELVAVALWLPARRGLRGRTAPVEVMAPGR